MCARSHHGEVWAFCRLPFGFANLAALQAWHHGMSRSAENKAPRQFRFGWPTHATEARAIREDKKPRAKQGQWHTPTGKKDRTIQLLAESRSAPSGKSLALNRPDDKRPSPGPVSGARPSRRPPVQQDAEKHGRRGALHPPRAA